MKRSPNDVLRARRRRLPEDFQNVDFFGKFAFDVLDVRAVGVRVVKPKRVADVGAHRLATRFEVAVSDFFAALDDRFPIFVVSADFVFDVDFLRLHQARGQAERSVGDGDVLTRKERRFATAPSRVEVEPFFGVERGSVELVAKFLGELERVAERANGRFGEKSGRRRANGADEKKRADGCLTSLRMTISRSIHVAANGNISFFLWLSNIPLCSQITSSSFIHLSVAL